jgi:dipeptidyl aminopeptidase/acylaminoacyl peptidase
VLGASVLEGCGAIRLRLTLAAIVLAAIGQNAPVAQDLSPAIQAPATEAQPARERRPDFARQRREQAETDRAWREASAGHMRMEKIRYRSRAGDLDVPAFVFQPLDDAPAHTRPALVWVHENIRGHLYEHYIPYIREATSRGYLVIAPEYRGSIGYGKAYYDAIDYGGAEVDDVVTAVDALKARYAEVNPARIGIIGWSHGGMITFLAITRNPSLFVSAVAMVPVTNLFQRLAWKGVEKQHALIDPQNRLGGLPSERHDVYKARSPLYQVDKLTIPILVQVTRNDQDVNFEEDEQLVDALRSRKPGLAETYIFDNPLGGHTFDRRVIAGTWEPQNTPDQRDSWQRVWTFFEGRLGIDN